MNLDVHPLEDTLNSSHQEVLTTFSTEAAFSIPCIARDITVMSS